MAEQTQVMREHPEFVRLLKTYLGRTFGRVFAYRYPRKDEGAEISLVHNNHKRTQIRIWTSFNQDGSRPQEDRFLHFLLIDLASDPQHKQYTTGLWHCQRIKYDGANPTQTIVLAGQKVEGLLTLADSRASCSSPLCCARTMPLYVKPADQIAWFCPILEHRFYRYLTHEQSKLIIARTDSVFVGQTSTLDPDRPTFKLVEKATRPKRQKQALQTAFSFQS